MYGLAVIVIMSLSGQLSNIDEILSKQSEIGHNVGMIDVNNLSEPK